MKRSEMIIKIMDYLLKEVPNANYDSVSSYSRRLDAENLLTMLESNGILPPKINKGYITILQQDLENKSYLILNKYTNETGWISMHDIGNQLLFPDNIWEPEDE